MLIALILPLSESIPKNLSSGVLNSKGFSIRLLENIISRLANSNISIVSVAEQAGLISQMGFLCRPSANRATNF